MKGVGPIAIAIVAMLAFLAISGGIMNTAFYRIENMMFSVKDIYVISEINRFETVKIGLPHAANYSFCQALYDVSKIGGYISLPEKSYRGIAMWRNYSWTHFPNYHFNITNMTYDIFGRYLSSIYSGQFSYPRYDLNMEEFDDSVILDFTSGGLLQYTSGVVELVLKQNPNASVNFNTLMKKMYALGREMFVDDDAIDKARQETYDGWPDDCKLKEMGDVCEQDIDPEGELAKNCPDVDITFNNSFISNITKLNGYYDNIYLTAKVDKSLVEHESSYTYSSSEEAEECGCKVWGESTEVKQTSPPEQPSSGCVDSDGGKVYDTAGTCANSTGFYTDTGSDTTLTEYFCDGDACSFETVDCLEWCKSNGYNNGVYTSGGCSCRECEKWYNMMHDVNYTYDYFAAARVLVSINDTKNICPAYDSYTDYRHTVLNFYVVSGNRELIK